MKVLNKLVEKGNTVLIIEHNLDVIKLCDHIIDIGKEGGMKGGKILCTGTPEEIIYEQTKLYGQVLKKRIKFISFKLIRITE